MPNVVGNKRGVRRDITRVNVRRLRPTAADTNDMSMLPQTLDATEIAAQTLELPPTPIRLLLVDGHAEILGSGR